MVALTKNDMLRDFEVDPDLPIWRYTSVLGLLKMIDSNALTFTRASELDDPWDGRFSMANWENHNSVYGDVADRMLPSKLAIDRTRRSRFYLNCWSQQETESEVMWNSFGDRHNGIAIRSTPIGVAGAMGSQRDISVYQIRYADYEKDWIPEANDFYPMVHKRNMFRDEREVRFIFGPGLNSEGNVIETSSRIPIQFDLNSPDLQLFIGHKVQDWQRELIKSLATKSGLSLSLNESAYKRFPLD